MILRRRNIEWARQWLEPGIRTAFAYTLKRNAEFGVQTTWLDVEEYYAVLRQTYGKRDIERIIKEEIVIL